MKRKVIGMRNRMWMLCLMAVVALALCVPGCKRDKPGEQPKQILKLATTTSTENTGLLKVLLPPFENANNASVQVISVGTGKALKLGEDGNVDVVLVHAKEAEMDFINRGYGKDRREVMYNDFIILGPADNPAGLEKDQKPSEAMAAIMDVEAPFISRGDDSGTHKKELQLWKEAGLSPGGRWYMDAGKGMGDTLVMAQEKQAYVMCDRGTYLSMRSKLNLKVLVEGDPGLYNLYGVIAVDPAKNKNVNYELAKKFAEWLVSPEAQKIIGDFKVDGEVLFHPVHLDK